MVSRIAFEQMDLGQEKISRVRESRYCMDLTSEAHKSS